jgi:hypothetical protein
MTQDLFIDSTLEFEKVASEVALPEDPNAWPNEILQELFKQVPYISDFEPHVVMDRVDAERGFAFGHVEVMNKTEIQRGMDAQGLASAGIKQARIPVIVKDRKLQPFDTLVTENSRVIPLTESRLRSAVFRPQAFDVTSLTPGDTSMIGQLYPPYRQNYGFGGGGASMSVGMGKQGEAKACPKCGSMEKCSCMGKASNFEDGTPSEKMGAAKPKMMKNVREGAEQFVDMARAAIKSRGEEVLPPEEKHRLLGFLGVPAAAGAGVGTAVGAGAGYAGGRMHEKSKHSSILADILPTIEPDTYHRAFAKLASRELQSALVANAEATARSLGILSRYELIDQAKVAAAVLGNIPCDVVQITKTANGYQIKVANHSFWAPVDHVYDRGQAVKAFGEKIVLAADMAGTATMAEGVEEEEPSASTPEADKPFIISEFGMYKVQDAGGRHLVGYVFPNLIDIDGKALPMALFNNGSQSALQGEIAGINVGGGASLFEGHPRGYGVFYEVLPNGRAQATIPLDIKAALSGPDQNEGATLHADTYDGRQVEICVQPNIQRLTPAGEGRLLVPESMRWMPLEKAGNVVLADNPESFEKTASPALPFVTVTIRAGGEDDFSLSGYPLNKLASEEKSFLSFDDTVFLLAGLGVAPKDAMQKMAEAFGHGVPTDVKTHRILKLASEQLGVQEKRADSIRSLVHELRVDLLKEAAVIPDPVAVDTVLSLNFINPENLGTFIGYLPLIDEAQSRMCELLIASRLGLRDVSPSALEKAVRATEEVLEGLKVLAFQKN